MSVVPALAKEIAAEHGAPLEGALQEQLARYLDTLLATNEAFNLTAVTDRDEAWIRHIADSLSLVPALRDLPAESAIVDVGSGGGLPGLPLAIALPQLRFTLLESTGKKAGFLEEATRTLGLTNVQVVCDRAETFGQGKGRERFAVATSRAVSPLRVLLELTLPLVKISGFSLAIKGGRARDEIADARRALGLLHS